MMSAPSPAPSARARRLRVDGVARPCPCRSSPCSPPWPSARRRSPSARAAPTAPSASWQRSIGALEKPGERTVETLKRHDFDARYRRDPDRAIAGLRRAAREQPEPDLVFALAELSWIEGRRLERHRRPGALDHYLDTVAYAFDFLFDPSPELAGGRQASDPRYRLACDLYNGGLDRLIHAAQAVDRGRILPDSTIRLKVKGGEQALRVALKDSSWGAADVDDLMLASDFEVTGLDSRSRLYGLGVPMIGVRRAKEKEAARGVEQLLPPRDGLPPDRLPDARTPDFATATATTARGNAR